MTSCSNQCRRSKTFASSKKVNVVTVPFDATDYKEDKHCVRCDLLATLMCGRCHAAAYCTKACILEDYARHQRECKLHCPRLKLFQDFERCHTAKVRIKHTGINAMGLGMYARKAFSPGERIIEDVVHYTGEHETIPAHVTEYADIINSGNKHNEQPSVAMCVADKSYGFWTRFINHSCIPNSVIELSECKKYILVTAIHPISAGRQITVSYFHAVYTPLRIRTPILKRILGKPCICMPCLIPQPSAETIREELWNVMQHNYGVRRYEVLEINPGRVDEDLVCAVANRIIDFAQALLGANLRASDPWLAYIYHAVLIYVEKAYKCTRSVDLKRYLLILRQDAAVTAEHLGFCTSMLID